MWDVRGMLAVWTCLCSCATRAAGADPANGVGASFTHWRVTEEGLRPQVDSPYEMEHPYDLLAFLNQDDIRSGIISMYHELVARKMALSDKWITLESATDIDRLLLTDQDCAEASPLDGIDLYSSLSELYEDVSSDWKYSDDLLPVQSPDIPDCGNYSSLTFSMFTFEHLTGMLQRNNLSVEPDLTLSKLILLTLTLDSFGHQIAQNLQKNNTSWLHYNLASMYWKVKGDAPKAMECSRRAVYYAPRQYKDVTLGSMGTLFHRSKKLEEAQILFQAAVDHKPLNAINHFNLANSFAVMGDFNTSIAMYNNSLKANPSFKQALQYKHGMLCFEKLKSQVILAQTTIECLERELKAYEVKEAHWWKQQAIFLRSMKDIHIRYNDLSSLDNVCAAMEELLGLDFPQMKLNSYKNSLLSLVLENPVFIDKFYDDPELQSLDAMLTTRAYRNRIKRQAKVMNTHIKNMLKIVDAHGRESNFALNEDTLLFGQEVKMHPKKHSDSKTEQEGERKKSADRKQQDYSEFEGGPILYPSTYKVNRKREAFDTEDNWPSQAICDKWAPMFPPRMSSVYPVFLPFENKGLKLKSLLSDKIGLSLDEEHQLPWHPPTCPEVKGAPAWLQQRTMSEIEKAYMDNLKNTFLKIVGDGDIKMSEHLQEAEIGHRIYRAINMKVAPKWLLYTLSALYWRVRANNKNALTCLQSANKLVPTKYRDIVLTSLASVLLDVGYLDEALSYAEQAYKSALYEPSTNFLLSLIHLNKFNQISQVFHMKQVVRVEPDYMGGLAKLMLHVWACGAVEEQVEPVHLLSMKALEEDGVCLETCNLMSNGRRTYCMSGVECNLLKKRNSQLEQKISTLARLLDNDPSGSAEPKQTESDEGALETLDDIIEAKEIALRDRYKLLEKMLKSCVGKDCSKLFPTDTLQVRGTKCFFQHLRPWFWLPNLRLEVLLNDKNIHVQSKLKLEHQTPFKFPDCKMPAHGDDATLDWMSRLNVDNWKPVTQLVTEVNNMVGNPPTLQDISGLLAYHIDNRPHWIGLVVAGMWCGGFSRGACCVRCYAAAFNAAPIKYRDVTLLSLVSVLHLQEMPSDAKYGAYLALNYAPTSKLHLFAVGISHTYVGEYEPAMKHYHMALGQDRDYVPAQAGLQATMCLILFLEDLANL